MSFKNILNSTANTRKIQASLSPFDPHDISVLLDLTSGHLRYRLTNVPPQTNSPLHNVFGKDQTTKELTLNPKHAVMHVSM